MNKEYLEKYLSEPDGKKFFDNLCSEMSLWAIFRVVLPQADNDSDYYIMTDPVGDTGGLASDFVEVPLLGKTYVSMFRLPKNVSTLDINDLSEDVDAEHLYVNKSAIVALQPVGWGIPFESLTEQIKFINTYKKYYKDKGAFPVPVPPTNESETLYRLN